MEMIRTLIFDLGGVIVPLDFEHGYREIAKYSPHPPDELRRRLTATDLYVRAEIGKIAPNEFYREMSGLLDLSADEVAFRRIWCSIFPSRTLIDDELLGSLHRCYRILLLSNTNQVHFEWILENYPILRHFDDFVLSYKVGHMKPAPEIYREAIRKAGCRAEECFFTDDVAINVEAARAEGMDAEPFVSSERLLAELAARGIDLCPPA